MLAEKMRKADRRKIDPTCQFEEQMERPLELHLGEWRKALTAKGTSARQGDEVFSRAAKLRKAVPLAPLPSLAHPDSARRVESWLADFRQPSARPCLPADKTAWTNELAELLGVRPCTVNAHVLRRRLAAAGNGRARLPAGNCGALLEGAQGRSVQTSNHYLAALKQFCRWLVRNRRLPFNPLESLQRGNVRLDRRHDRQTLSRQQLVALLETARASTIFFRGLSGEDRYHLYLTALSIGFRKSELASLAPASFALASEHPTVTIPARMAKNRTLAVQPIKPTVADELAVYLSSKPAGLPVWPGTWSERAAEMLRDDLEAAGIPYVVEGPDGPLYADLHALRHTFIAMLDDAGQPQAGHATGSSLRSAVDDGPLRQGPPA